MSKLLTLDRILKLEICYDAQTGTFTRAGRQIATTPNDDGYVSTTIDYRDYLLHRLTWFMMTGKWPAGEVIHANDDRADNRWRNLRLVSASQRAQRRLKPNALGMRGVRLTPAGFYRATISRKRRAIHLGTFSTIEAASAAYGAAALEYYGEAART